MERPKISEFLKKSISLKANAVFTYKSKKRLTPMKSPWFSSKHVLKRAMEIHLLRVQWKVMISQPDVLFSSTVSTG